MEKPIGLRILPVVPWAQPLSTPKESGGKDNRASTIIPVRTIPDARRQPRFKIEIDITINSRTGGTLKGRTVDIIESGIAAMLRIEAPLDEIVELSFALPCGPVRIHATVRQRNAFRYGFEFVDQDLVHEFIRRTCRDLAVDQSMTWPDLK